MRAFGHPQGPGGGLRMVRVCVCVCRRIEGKGCFQKLTLCGLTAGGLVLIGGQGGARLGLHIDIIHILQENWRSIFPKAKDDPFGGWNMKSSFHTLCNTCDIYAQLGHCVTTLVDSANVPNRLHSE